MNPSTAFGTTFADELVRCGLREVVLAPGSRSTPLAMAFGALDAARRIRVHVRIDERSAAFTALGLARASGRPAAIVCTSGTAAANFHPAVIEADESGIPLLILTTDRPPELRGTGANQAIDQIKLYGSAVRWFTEVGVPEGGPGGLLAMARYWRSLACQAWAHAAGLAGGFPGPVHLNLPLREPLVPDDAVADDGPLGGRSDGAAWTKFAPASASADVLDLPWTERGVLVCGDGVSGAAHLLAVAEQAGWPVLAEPSSAARCGPNALSAYQYLLGSPEFIARHQPELIVSAGRPGLSRAQTAFLRDAAARHVVIAQGPDRWADPVRAATDVASGVRLGGRPAAGGNGWLADWLRADRTVRAAVDAQLDAVEGVSEPRLARDLAAALPEGALLWTGSSLPVRDLDCHMPARTDIRVLASRGASGIDGTTSAAIGAALAHDGPSFALLGDLAFVHDAPGLATGPREPRPDLCLIVVNNDGGGIFSTLEQAAYPGFERLFGTPHGAGLHHLAAAFGVPYQLLDHPDDLAKAIQGRGLRIIEVRTDRTAGADLRARLRAVAATAARSATVTLSIECAIAGFAGMATEFRRRGILIAAKARRWVYSREPQSGQCRNASHCSTGAIALLTRKLKVDESATPLRAYCVPAYEVIASYAAPQPSPLTRLRASRLGTRHVQPQSAQTRSYARAASGRRIMRVSHENAGPRIPLSSAEVSSALAAVGARA